MGNSQRKVMDVHDKIINIIANQCLEKPYKKVFKHLLHDKYFRNDVIDVINKTIFVNGEVMDDNTHIEELLFQVGKLIISNILEQLVHNNKVEVLVGPDGVFRYRWID